MPPTELPAPPASPAPPPEKYFPNGDPDAPLNPRAARNTDSCLPLYGDEAVHNYACDGPAPGDIAFRWIRGSICPATNADPRIQIVSYNEDTYILRQNVCVHWEAPFTYLLFGNKGALLIDTGATQGAAFYPLRDTVDAIIRRWCRIRRKTDVPLTIVLTSGEDVAQNQGLVQFADRPNTRIAPKPLAEMKAFYDLGDSWPIGASQIDLGGRIITVIPTPGTHKDGVTFYDPYNRFLYTGDLFYPGRIQIANDRDYAASLARLVEWKRSHPLKWTMGGHIEMMFVPGRAYPRFATHKPYEHYLEMDPALLDDALACAQAIAGQVGVISRAEYTLLNRVSPDEDVYRTAPNVPDIPVSIWLP